jgi:hypothetical protein
MTTQAPFKSFHVTLPDGIEFTCNEEGFFPTDLKAKLSDLLSWIMGDIKDREKIFAPVIELLKPVANDAVVSKLIKDVRVNVKENTSQCSAYKLCYMASLLSHRKVKELFLVLKAVKESMQISTWESAMIHDAVLSEFQDIGSPAFKLNETDRVSLVALNCLLLRLDNATHVLETEVLRVNASSLRAGAIQPAVLMSSMGKNPEELFQSLESNSKIWALMHLMRIGAADGAVRPREFEFIEKLAKSKGVAEKDWDFVKRISFLETGKVLPVS